MYAMIYFSLATAIGGRGDYDKSLCHRACVTAVGYNMPPIINSGRRDIHSNIIAMGIKTRAWRA